MMPGAAWTPDAPDAPADSPSALIAAGQQAPGFDPESLDHFDGINTCGAQFSAVLPPTHGDTAWLRIELHCTEDDGHYPATPHRGEHVWTDTPTVPGEPVCPQCADVGVGKDGEPCMCPAGDPFAAAVDMIAANKAWTSEVPQ